MSNKHTPGPWIVEKRVGAGIEIWANVNLGKSVNPDTDAVTGPNLQPIYEVQIKPSLAVADDGTVVAQIAYESWRQFPSTDFKKMQDANAQLIGAAPDLLEALQDILSYPLVRTAHGKPNYSSDPQHNDTTTEWMKIVERAEAAIKKATS